MSKRRGDFGPNNQMWLGFYNDYTQNKTKTFVQTEITIQYFFLTSKSQVLCNFMLYFQI